ncbi:unnamed protein product [Soboliphyme baturini]|uniref:RNA-directed DNA polymerase n=1 Tax=Soboliphyme baturini TaxID=241478 RepID=A0A183JAM7_9BILA|nr:unnamed protein product [Soboliphyme baturini]
MGILRRVAGLTRLDMVRNSDIRKIIGLEPLVLQIEKSQLRWLGHVLQMAPESKAKQLFLANPTGKRPREQSRLTWCKHMEGICSRLHLSFAEAQTVAQDRERWKLCLTCLPSRPERRSGDGR